MQEMASEPSAFDLKVNILLVDDQPADLLALRAILDELGHNLVEAHSGEEALRRLQAEEYAVILLDVQMYGLDGFETAKQIRGTAKTRHIPIIFLTGYSDDRFPVVEAYSLGAVDYLVKPLVPVILRAKVAGFVELFQKTEQVKRQAEQLRQLERRGFEQRLAEENARLRDSEQRFARFMQHLPGLAWIKDLEGRYVYANDAAEKAFLTPRTELYGKSDAEIFPPETATQFQKNDQQALASSTGIQVMESLPQHDGSRQHFLVNKFPILGPDGNVGLVGGMAIDISDRLQAEEALKEADRRKDEFLAMLAHELRNPLAPVLNALHILKTPEVNAAGAQQARDIIERQVQHLARLVDDLLDVSRILRNRIELRKEQVDLGTVFARAVEMAQSVVDVHGHELRVGLPSTPVFVHGDPVRLAQVIGNLLVNAAKYTDKAGLICLMAERDGDQAVIRVRDTGIGIEPEVLPHIFDLFTQADRSLARSKGGLGIGLTLVKRLVEMHGGKVQAFSSGPGRGSEFIVRLRALPEARGDVQTTPADEVLSATDSPRRVLVVDDNKDAADSTAAVLRLLGHSVHTVYDGSAVVDAVRSFRPDVVFLDIGLPGMDGFDVAMLLREQPENASLVLVAVTGYGQDEHRRRAREAGFNHHLVKPVDPAELHKLLCQPREAIMPGNK